LEKGRPFISRCKFSFSFSAVIPACPESGFNLFIERQQRFWTSQNDGLKATTILDEPE
jgi:hypothetical protein